MAEETSSQQDRSLNAWLRRAGPASNRPRPTADKRSTQILNCVGNRETGEMPAIQPEADSPRALAVQPAARALVLYEQPPRALLIV